MTREEATFSLNSILASMDRSLNDTDRRHLLIQGLAALGILKLDEPKSVNERAWEVLRDFTPHATVIDRLHAAGLKIVEK